MNTHTFCRRRRERLLSSGYGRPRRADGRGPRVACPGSRSEVAAAYSTRSSKGENRRPGRLPLRGRWYDIEGSPVYTAPMRARGIEPRSLPWRGSGLPLTDSRLSFEIGRVDGSNESPGRRANDSMRLRPRVAGRRTSDGSDWRVRYRYATLHLRDGVGGVEAPIFRSKYLPSTVRPCGIPESNGVLRFGGPPCGLHTHAAMLPPGFEPGSTRRGRGMRSVAPRQPCRQPESNRRPTFEGRRCLTALHHDGVAAPRFARGPRLCKSRILGARPCCRHSPLRKSGGPREKRPAIRRRRVVTRHPRRRAATAAVDSRGFEPRLRFARPACFQLHHEPIRPAKESDLLGPAGPARYPPTIAAWRLAVRPAGQRRKEWSRCPP